MAGYSGAAEGPRVLLPLSGPERERLNRRIIAERTGWPVGAVEACERIERDHPGRVVAWMHEYRCQTPGFDREEGFYAWWRGDDPGRWLAGHGHVRRAEYYGADADALEKALLTGAAHPDHP
jgi:hypothetical protein